MSHARRPGNFLSVTRLGTRLRSGFLFGLFLAGSLGVPLADAAVFHLADKDPCAGITHVEPQGGSHHADRCTLAQPTAAQRAAIDSTKAVRVAPPLAIRIVVPSATALLSTAFVTLQHSRAPPA